MRFSASISTAVLCCALLGGCTNTPEHTHPDFAPSFSEHNFPTEPAIPPTGGIYQSASHNLTLFNDMRAHQVGDILTVVLAEATDGAKSSDTSLGKSNSAVIENPLLAGQLRTIGSDSNLSFDLSSEQGFDGESASNQRNSLQGSITVTVAKVYPSGNLYVQGEKWIQINQGDEVIRLRGIIRPVDISTNNTIVSTKVADARISYSGTGATADANRVGWLSRFFLSPIWPF
ncbi:flagellar basal body L-ring protein FlgH [Pseudohalioglobus lutimaris]|uniref:flagellar basal body L-ring protein FlgH n=1 Tax=Pseudohalioglobus lutimaris TaxID=1737061 RepID=UPI001E289722|nr:flagellar basal body L-ring protein FlgH [Pseudohalioglobus lutimaris]